MRRTCRQRSTPTRRRSLPRSGEGAGDAASSERDLRLDLFRGIALWLIFLDHIPSNIVSWITIRNYGFTDATEIFVFISGYTAAFVYGRAMRERGVIVASARILKRAWQVYVAHIFLFVIYMAEIAYVSASFENPLYGEEMGIFDFLRQPDVTLVQALMLKFKPANMDVLPLYIVLLAGFPPMLWCCCAAPTVGARARRSLLYLLTWMFGWNLPAYPNGSWVFNPFAWQLLFVFGAWCALGGAKRLAPLIQSRVRSSRPCSISCSRSPSRMTWYFPRLRALRAQMAPGLDVSDRQDQPRRPAVCPFHGARSHHGPLIPEQWSFLNSSWLRPAILCGQHSLEIFCLGVFLSFAGHFAMVEINEGLAMQIGVSVLGIVIMVAAAAMISWYKKVEGRSPGSRSGSPGGKTLLGGGA